MSTSVMSSVTQLYDFHAPGWFVPAMWLLAVGLLALAVRWYLPRTPVDNRLGPGPASPPPSDTPTARSVSTIALGAGLMVIVAHVLFALFVVPVFEKMFASVNVALPEPAQTMMALSARRLLAPSYIALDATVLLLWFRFGRPTWVQLFLVVGAIFAVITVVSCIAMVLPMLSMMNAVQ